MRREDVEREHRHTGTDPWEDRLSDYLDDELSGTERGQVEDHLRACASCSAVLAELRAVVARAGQCARESEPAADLWAGIQPRLQPRRKAPWRTLLQPGVGDRGGLTPPRAWWRAPALAAAAVLALAVAASVFWPKGGGEVRPGDTGQAGTRPYEQADTQEASGKAIPSLEAGREYYDTVAELRRLVERRLTHDPRVVEVLDSNLAAIDAAIAGYRDALAANPGDEALQRRLAESRRRKVEVLRQAAALSSEAAN